MRGRHLLRGRGRTGRHGADHPLEQFEVVVGVARGGVARAQHGGQRLVGVVAPRCQRVESEPVLVGGRGILLVRMHVEQGGVEVPDHRANRWLRRPDTRPSRRHRQWDGPQLDRSRRVHGPPCGGHRRHRAEELLLFFEHREVGQTVRTVGNGDGEMREHDTRIVGVPVDPALGHGLRHRPGQAAAIGQFG